MFKKSYKHTNTFPDLITLNDFCCYFLFPRAVCTAVFKKCSLPHVVLLPEVKHNIKNISSVWVNILSNAKFLIKRSLRESLTEVFDLNVSRSTFYQYSKRAWMLFSWTSLVGVVFLVCNKNIIKRNILFLLTEKTKSLT